MTYEKQTASDTQRIYQGPPRKLNKYPIDLASVQSRRGMPGGKSAEDQYNELYGPRGSRWDFDTTSYDDENAIRAALEQPEFDIASEGMRNLLWRGRYETDDGIDLTGKVQRYVATPPLGDIVVYPDGDRYRAEREDKA